MAQRVLYQEPVSVLQGGTGLRVPTGILAGLTSNALRQIAATENHVLRSNGAAWQYALGGRLLQVVTSSYSTAVMSNTNTWIATGLTGQITPKKSDSSILIAVKQNGLARLGNGGTSFGSLRLLWGAAILGAFGYPYGFQNTLTLDSGSGSGSIFATVTPGNTNLQTFSTQQQSSGTVTQIFTQVSSIPMSSMLLMELAAT